MEEFKHYTQAEWDAMIQKQEQKLDHLTKVSKGLDEIRRDLEQTKKKGVLVKINVPAERMASVSQ